MRGENSWRNCRHEPHGEEPSPAPAVTATAVNSRSPSLTALSAAVRSAHIQRPNEAFSTLHPWTTRPARVSSAAPTANSE